MDIWDEFTLEFSDHFSVEIRGPENLEALMDFAIVPFTVAYLATLTETDIAFSQVLSEKYSLLPTSSNS